MRRYNFFMEKMQRKALKSFDSKAFQLFSVNFDLLLRQYQVEKDG
jgi:hypothetical protein